MSENICEYDFLANANSSSYLISTLPAQPCTNSPCSERTCTILMPQLHGIFDIGEVIPGKEEFLQVLAPSPRHLRPHGNR